jgi:hypothetical protein
MGKIFKKIRQKSVREASGKRQQVFKRSDHSNPPGLAALKMEETGHNRIR